MSRTCKEGFLTGPLFVGYRTKKRDYSCYIISVFMGDYDKEKWVKLYHTALLELKEGAMMGRIGDARTEIAFRLEILESVPDLHTEEREAIRGALNNLRVLEREEERLAEIERKRLLEDAVQKLQKVAPRFENKHA
jgi:hypothetical protein